MAKLTAFLFTLLLFAGAIANPVPSEYDIIDDSDAAKLRRHHDDCHNVKPKTVWKTRTTTKTKVITVPKTVWTKIYVKTTKTHTHTFTKDATATTQQKPSTVTVYRKTLTTTTTVDKVLATTTFTSITKVRPTSTKTVWTTEYVPALEIRHKKDGNCHTPTSTKTRWVTKTTSVWRTKTTTKPVYTTHIDYKNENVIVTVTDTTVTLKPSTTYIETSFFKTKVIVEHSTSTILASTTILTTKTLPWPSWTTVTSTTRVPKPTSFCDTLDAGILYNKETFASDPNSQSKFDRAWGIKDLKKCCMKCLEAAPNSCQFFTVNTHGNGLCKFYTKVNGLQPDNTCLNGKVAVTLVDQGAAGPWLGQHGPCGSLA